LERLIGRLLRRGWLAPEEVRDPGMRVIDHSARYACFEFAAPGGRGAIVKTPSTGESPGPALRELRALVSLREGRGRQALRAAIPRVRGGDARTGTLVLERILHRGSLGDWGLTGRLPSTESIVQFGRAVRELHESPATSFASRRADQSRPPWVLALGQPLPLSMLQESTPASLHVLRSVHGSATLRSALDELREGWTRTSPIHGDLRWENCLVEPQGRSARIRLIDWEQASIGDPAWDVAAFLGESVRAWLFHESNERERVLSAATWFWNGYAGTSPRDATWNRDTLHRAARLAGAWLLARVFERAETRDSLDDATAHSLRIVSSLIARPMRACTVLFGLG
jgi:hypothetical protein